MRLKGHQYQLQGVIADMSHATLLRYQLSAVRTENLPRATLGSVASVSHRRKVALEWRETRRREIRLRSLPHLPLICRGDPAASRQR
jgi:hypothetical protein